MIGTIRKHQQWLWYVIIAAIIISFVWFFSPNAKMDMGGGRSIDLGSINGKPITVREYQDAQKEAALTMFFRYQQWPKQNEQLRRMVEESTYQILLINAKLKQLDVQVTPEATARMIKQYFGIEPNQAFPMDKYQEFISNPLNKEGLTEQDFERFIAHQVGQQHLASVLGVSGQLITSKEAESFYRRENQPVSAQLASFAISNYVSKVTATPKDVEEFYNVNQAAYRIPDQVQVDYIKFETTNFWAEADKELGGITNLNAMVDNMYTRMGAEAFKDEAGKQMSEKDAKAQIKNRQRDEVAIKLAEKKAYEFLNDVYNAFNDAKPFSPEAFKTLAESKGLKVKTTEAFEEQSGPRQVRSREFASRAFQLMEDPSDPSKRSLFSTTPISTQDGVYAISLKRRIPSHIQPLEAVRNEVTATYRENKARELVMAAGEQFATAVTNGLAAGKTFEAICTANKVKCVNLTPFSMSTNSIPEVDRSTFGGIQQVVSTLPVNTASPFVPSQEGGFVLFVKARLPVDEQKLKADLPAFTTRLREQRQGAAFGEWFQNAAKEMNLVRPQYTKE